MGQNMEKQDKFIEKANIVHNGRYLYDKVKYINSVSKVCIICPEHGEFWQSPSEHMRGKGCPKCANERRGRFNRMTLGEFISKAKEIHGNRFDYEKVEYHNTNTKVCIICPEHGEFWQTPLAHIFNRQACPKCAHRGLNRDELISEFIKVHGNKYDYSKFELGKMNNKACFVCPEHGEFFQSPTKHLEGQGCPICGRIRTGRNNRMDTTGFIKKAKEVHGDKYDYSKCTYVSSHNLVSITCPKHGEFQQIANYHLCGHGCPVCGNNISIAEDEISAEHLRWQSLRFEN